MVYREEEKMFEKKKCPNCGEKVKDEFSYCPYCGKSLSENPRRVALRPLTVFEDIDKEFERIDKSFGSDFFKIPRVRPVRGGGISITIHSGAGMTPKIEVRTSGQYKRVEPEIKKKFGVGPSLEEIEEEKTEAKPIRVPKITEEPETNTETIGSRQVISVKLPGVKEKDLEVKRLEQSAEIKGFAGGKAYFKLIPIPPNASISKKFKNGILKIEIER